MTRSARLGLRLGALVLGDLLALVGALLLAYLLRFRWELGALERVPPAPFVEYVKALVLVLFLVPVLLQVHGLYRATRLRSGLEEVSAIVKAVTIGAVLVLAVTFFYRREGFHYSRLTFVYWWALSIAGIAGLHATFRGRLLARYRRGLDVRRAVIVGAPSAYLVEQLRADAAFGIELVGYLSDAPAEEAVAGRTPALVRSAVARDRDVLAVLPRLGGTGDLPDVLGRHAIEEALVVEHAFTHRALLEAIGACEAGRVAVHLIAPTYDLLIDSSDLGHVNGIPLIRLDETRRRGSLLAKRLFDVVVSSALLILLAPLFGALALAIRMGSTGPVFFVQTRAGLNGRPFRMVKFRTMVPDAEERLDELVDMNRLEEPVFKLAEDPRVTRVGRVLRRFSLDELPQLWNVLKGDMSLVGPRPEELRVVDRYDVWQRRRLKVKPGLTGLQQVARRGTTSLNERVRLDVYYMRKRTFLLDLVILLRTLSVVATGKGAS